MELHSQFCLLSNRSKGYCRFVWTETLHRFALGWNWSATKEVLQVVRWCLDVFHWSQTCFHRVGVLFQSTMAQHWFSVGASHMDIKKSHFMKMYLPYMYQNPQFEFHQKHWVLFLQENITLVGLLEKVPQDSNQHFHLQNQFSYPSAKDINKLHSVHCTNNNTEY